MTTKREGVLAYLPTFLASNLAGAACERERKRPVARASDSYVNIVPESDVRLSTGGKDYIDRRLTIDFQIHIRGASSAADAIVDALHNRLMSDRVLGGRCTDIEAADINDFEFDDGDEDLCIVHQRYEITYRSLETNLSA